MTFFFLVALSLRFDMIFLSSKERQSEARLNIVLLLRGPDLDVHTLDMHSGFHFFGANEPKK